MISRGLPHHQRNDDRRAVGLGSLTRGRHIPVDGRQEVQGSSLHSMFVSSLNTGRGLRGSGPFERLRNSPAVLCEGI